MPDNKRKSKKILTYITGPDGRPLFGSATRQPQGLNPPPLELRSPTPKQGQLL
jgi:hypothetical protein